MNIKRENMISRLITNVVLVLFMLLISEVSDAKMYEYTDANGKTHYTNIAPPQKAKKIVESKETVEDSEEKSIRLMNAEDEREERYEAEQRVKHKRREEKAREARLQKRFDEIDRKIELESEYGKVLRSRRHTNGTQESFGRTKANTLVCSTHMDYVIRSSISCHHVDNVKIIWVSDYVEKNPKGNTVKFQYWAKAAEGKSSSKKYGYTALTNIQ